MRVHEFFKKYANTPIEDRFKLLGITESYGSQTLSTIYKTLESLEDQMRPLRILEEQLLELAVKGWKDLKKVSKR